LGNGGIIDENIDIPPGLFDFAYRRLNSLSLFNIGIIDEKIDIPPGLFDFAYRRSNSLSLFNIDLRGEVGIEIRRTSF